MTLTKLPVKSIKQFARVFQELEMKNNLLDLDIKGVKLWQYLRFRIYLNISRELGLFEIAHTKKVGLKDILLALPSLLYYSILSNPLSGIYHKDILIFNAGRKVNVDGEMLDIYSDFFISKLKAGSFEVIEELYLNKHLVKSRRNRKHQDYQLLRTTIKSKIDRFKLNRKEKNAIKSIENEILQTFGIKLELEQTFINGHKAFKYDFEFYNKLIQKRNPSKIYLVCSYGYKMALISAARKNDVETIEFQHGTMSKYNFGYSYPDVSKIEYFPDKIHFFGNYWKNCMPFPLKEENKIVSGFTYFQKQQKHFGKIKKQGKTLLVISQGTIGKKLSEFIYNSIESLKEMNVVYKLHPGEYDRWQKEYPALVEISKLKNFEIVDNAEINLYEHMAISEFVIGVYSTAVYEALAFNCKVILADLPGIEYLEDLIEKGFVKLASQPQQLQKLLASQNWMNFDSKDFFG